MSFSVLTGRCRFWQRQRGMQETIEIGRRMIEQQVCLPMLPTRVKKANDVGDRLRQAELERRAFPPFQAKRPRETFDVRE